MKASVYIATSLDGFIARKNGSLDWLPGADGTDQGSTEDYGYRAFMSSIDHTVMGRKTFEFVSSMGDWPYSTPVTVLSHSFKELPSNLPQSVHLFQGSPQELWSKLKKEGYRHLYVDGGLTIQSFLRLGLIDELTLTGIPILLGEGIPLFGPIEKDIHLKHIRTQSYPSGFVQRQYYLLK